MPPRPAKKTTATRKPAARKPAAAKPAGQKKMQKMATELRKAATVLMRHSKQIRASSK